ncbi:MAG: hypothetical protein UR73_C0037G0016 [candidate division WS6 bacterium GW2011_GWF1_35_23]|uniref:Uncharacterized protein n=1 Tax=candidate division WS6 bacterium GW2011_GWF1_35_23 TaxID=1619097 RepID=A0A0G0F5B5_9BACT|nr:MAG: hypothetical protein UR73_C0037G0016 [candidate division WS6 bacterium GW2011_GWF1_35_23]
MEQAVVNRAEVLLQKRNLNLPSKPFMVKHEKMPAIIHGSELTEAYNRTDLEAAYVLFKCKELKVLKDIQLEDQRIFAFYIEFIHMGWTKKIFDQRFEAVKRAKLYGTVLDFSTWMESEITYNESDFELEVDRRINSLIQKGERLSRMDIELTDEEKKYVQMAAAKKIEYELKVKRIEIMEKAIESLREKYLKTLKGKKLKIAEMDLAKEQLLQTGYLT